MYSSYQQENDSNEVAQYNEASLAILRLNDSWIKCNEFRRHGMLQKWKFELDIIWDEIYSSVKRHRNSNAWLLKNKKLKEKIARAINRTSLYNALQARHEFIKDVQDGVGKGTKYVDENAGLEG